MAWQSSQGAVSMTELPPDALAPDRLRHGGGSLPNHVAVIMDGNGRWARQRGASRLEGHQRGVGNVRNLVESCVELGIGHLTLFAFSSENWRRPQQEIQWLMRLLARALDKEVQALLENGVRLRFIGDISRLPAYVQTRIGDAADMTESQQKLNLTIAVNYGGKWDLAQACRKVAHEVASGSMTPDDVTPAAIEQFLSTADMPAPDFFIRTGGEKRMSNFMLWQLAYAELYFTDTYWPDFDRREFELALASYAKRIRRFGRTDEQVIAETVN